MTNPEVRAQSDGTLKASDYTVPREGDGTRGHYAPAPSGIQSR